MRFLVVDLFKVQGMSFNDDAGDHQPRHFRVLDDDQLLSLPRIKVEAA